MTAEGPGRRSAAAAGSARRLAMQVVERVLDGAFLAPSLRSALDRSDLAPVDRSFVTDLSYGTLRRLAWLDAALAPRLRAPEQLPGPVLCALRLGTYDLLIRGTPPHAGVHAWVEAVKADHPRMAGLVNAVLRRVEPPISPTPAARLALPDWLLEGFRVSLGDADAERAAAAMLEPGPLWLRAYTPDAAERLLADGCEVAAGPVAGTLRVRAPRPLDRLEAYRDGAVQPQNPASCLAAELLAPSEGERVLDLAAGHGIKTAQLASTGARVTAVEVDERKARASAANLRRLGLTAEHRTADLTRRLDLAAAPAVLLDAPCSGSGTLRGHPEIKLRLGPPDVAETARRQASMLDTAAALTAPGGRLVYAVCSLLEPEGEAQVSAFVDRHPEFTADVLAPSVPHVASPHGAYLLPLEGLDGFFVARLRRA